MGAILAGIITYNPEIERLKENIHSIIEQVDQLVIIDNNSENYFAIESICKGTRIILKRNFKNLGIAKALNQIFQYANKRYEWILTLDQDSVCPQNYISKAKKYMSLPTVGIICPMYIENKTYSILGRQIKKEYEYVRQSMTSGSIIRDKAYWETSGFDDELFMDYVDFDFSVKIRHAGFKILKMTETFLSHELGQSEIHTFLFWRFRVSFHNSTREYYIGRNIIIYIKRYYLTENIIRPLFSLLKNIMLLLLFDSSKKTKLDSLLLGIKEGINYKV